MYTQKSMDVAQVIADTPVFADYQLLDKQYPDSKFIYLDRDIESWVRSVKSLLRQMSEPLIYNRGNFPEEVKRCYRAVFGELTLENYQNDEYLRTCFSRHKQACLEYFKDRPESLLVIELANDDDFPRVFKFVGYPSRAGAFPRFNAKGQVTDWDRVRSELKISPGL